MNALDKLKNKYQTKEYKDKNTIEACSKLKHSLDTSELYLKTNSKSIDPTVLGLVYKQIVKNTSPILPKDCNITKPIDFSHHDYNDCHMIETSYYSVRRFTIDKSAKDNPLIQYSYSFNTGFMNSKIHHDLLKYSFSKMKSLQKHERKVKNNLTKLIISWFIGCAVSVLGAFASLLISGYLTATLLVLATLIVILAVPVSVNFCDKYDDNHHLSSVCVLSNTADIYDFLEAINKLKDNVTKLMSSTKEDKSKLAHYYSNEVKGLKEDHQLNLPPVKHLKQIENEGNDWSALSKKAFKLERQHKI